MGFYHTGHVMRPFLLGLILWGFLIPEWASAQVKPQIFLFQESSAQVDAVAFSPDGKFAMSGSQGIISIWDLSTGTKSRAFGKKSTFAKTVFSPDGNYALICSFGSVLLWDISTVTPIKEFRSIEGTPSVAFSPDGRYVLFAGFPMSLWDISSGRLVRKFEMNSHFDSIASVAFSPDGRYIASGSRDYTIKLWNAATGECIQTLEGHASRVNCVAFSPDGRFVLSGSDDYTMRQWDADTGEELRVFKRQRLVNIHSLTFTKDGRYIATTDGHEQIILWDFHSGKEAGNISGYPRGIGAVSFSSDGRWLLSAHDNNQMQLWDVEAIKSFYQMEWTEENRLVWDKKLEAQRIASMIGFDDGQWAIMTPEGYFNISQNGAKHIKVRLGNSAYSIDNFFERYYYPGKLVQRLSGIDIKLADDIRQGVEIPPEVKITSPKPSESFEEALIEVAVSAKDMGGGVDEIKLFHNDCAVSGKTRGIRLEPEEKGLVKKYKIRLLAGDNYLKAIGFSTDRTESNAHTIKVRYTGKTEKTDLYLVVVGINEYENPDLQLNYALADAGGLKEFFSRRWKPLFKDIYVEEIYDSEATKTNIKETLAGLGAKEQDVVLAYFAGHGITIDEEWYFVSHDVLHPEREEEVREKGMSATELAGMIMDIPALKKVVLIDACKSGGLMLALSRGFEDRRAIARLARSTGTHIVAASTEEQLASEISQLGHGVFTYTLLQGLGGEAQDKNNLVTIRGLITYIENELPEISEKYHQKAQYPVSDSRGQDFPLVMIK